jgi:hypothetical protein
MVLADAKAHVKHIGDNSGKMTTKENIFVIEPMFWFNKNLWNKTNGLSGLCQCTEKEKTGYWISRN